MNPNNAARACARPGGAGVIWLGVLLCAHAGAADRAPERAFFEDLPVVISASRIPQSLASTPGAMTIIDREQIRATGYRTIPQLLRLVPGMAIAQERGHLTHVAYHGLAGTYPNRMQVLIDGRSVYSPHFLGGVDWASLPLTLEEIDRIEVLRGANSAAFGSNAFMGVVNIVTRHSAQDRGHAVTLSSGREDLLDVGYRFGGSAGDLDFRFNAQISHDEGLRQLNDNFGSGVLTFRGDLRLDSDTDLTLLGGIHQGRRGFGYPGDPTNNNGLRDERDTTGFVNLRWRRRLGADDELSIGYYRNTERVRHPWSVYLPPLFPIVPVDLDRYSTRDNIDVQHHLRWSADLRMVWGVELRADRLDSARFFFSQKAETQRLMRGYAHAEYRWIPGFNVNAGAMIERLGNRPTTIAPRLFANWQVDAAHTLRIGHSRAYRSPSLFEERGDLRYLASGVALLQRVAPSPGVEPERIDAFELGYLGQFATIRTSIDVRLYHEKLAHVIDTRTIRSPLTPAPLLSPFALVWANAYPAIKIRGGEVQLRSRPWDGTEFLAGFAQTKILAPTPQLVSSAPRSTQSVMWLQRFPGNVRSTVAMYRVSPYQWPGGSVAVDAFTAYDLRLAYATRWSGTPVEVALTSLNEGSPHDEFTLVRTPRAPVTRQLFATVRFGF